MVRTTIMVARDIRLSITAFLLPILLFLFLALPTDAATVTFTFPTSSSLQSANITPNDGQNVTLDVTVAIATADVNVTNVSFYYRKGSSGSWIFIGTNTTLNHTQYLFPWRIDNLTDGATYQVNATAINESVDAIGSTTVTGITIDNTEPGVTLNFEDPTDNNAEKTKFFFGNDVNIVCTRTDATSGFNYTNITLDAPNSNLIESLEQNTDTGTASRELRSTYSTTKTLGFYTVYCSSTDKAGNTNSTANKTFEIVVKPPQGSSIFASENFKPPVAKILIGIGTVAKLGPLTETGISRQMAPTAEAIVTIDGKEHSIKLKEITDSTGTFTINNNFDATIKKGEVKPLDVDADGKDDMSIELHKKFKNKADTTFKLLTVQTGPSTPTPPTVDTPTKTPTTSTKSEGRSWLAIGLWAVVIILIILVAVHFLKGKSGGSSSSNIPFNKKDLGAYRNQGAHTVGPYRGQYK